MQTKYLVFSVFLNYLTISIRLTAIQPTGDNTNHHPPDLPVSGNKKLEKDHSP